MRVPSFVVVAVLSSTVTLAAADGEESYQTRCALCHGGDGAGSDRADSILPTLSGSATDRLATIITEGVPEKGMPAIEIPADELALLLTYLKSLAAEAGPAARDPRAPRPRAGSLQLSDGRAISGAILNESGFDAQLRAADGSLHLLRREEDAYREPAIDPYADWSSYNGSDSSNRHSPLDQIDRSTVERLTAQWFFPIPDVPMLEGTPVVIAGVMYVTSVNQVYALDATTGREIWRYSQPRTEGLVGDPAIGLNRGVAVRDQLLFTVTDHAHVIALNRFSGELVWDAEMADHHDHYGAVAAPLVVNDLVIAGISAGDTGLRGFLDAYDATTGERAWRFWTIPAPGEPGSETWGDADVLRRGCGATWLTGSFDAELELLYWPTGNPCPDLNGDRRPGDNLYTNSVVALKPRTGELAWHFQFTPHDTHDWDAQEPLLLLDEEFRGRPRKLLVQGNRNGFFYVLDRTNGQFLLGEPFVNQTWAAGMDDSGRPIVLPGTNPTTKGTDVCPAIRGATNWWATSYHPGTKLFYLLAHESCMTYTSNDQDWQRGRSWLGGTVRLADGSPNQKFIRAIDIQTGDVVWSYAQTGQAQTYSGVLSTGGDLVFFGEDSGAFAALDAHTGEPLWHFQANQDWKASPMTYMVGGRQYVAIASGLGFWAFALPE
ncbi:MAG: PQQ-binding-like beta-propeller repeat protein [Vicinamibacterales bacterium]|nr:PQQ-binding-like beta-propeller repeat protein [Vicinamibacterales bacterium]MDP7691264.1 PQQ-binding-like beta-propeller repeat protein [Vicinamibacterales bacterium]HJN42985.1 PQQ-binding-like beta-propeller repeat protein [Vicinamibacterales bacterium]